MILWISLALVLVGLYALYAWVKVPFPLQPRYVETSKRKLCHERYASSKLREDHTYDYVIIGSGMSGLSSATLLSRTGKTVLVLDKHPTVAGGCTHTFEEGRDEFDAGLHYTVRWSGPLLELVGGKEVAIPFDRLGDENGAFDRIVIGDDAPFDLKHGETHLDLWRAMCVTDEDRAGLEEYLKISTSLNNHVGLYVLSKLFPRSWQPLFWRLFLGKFSKWAKLTAKEALFKLLPNNAKLRAHLCSLWIDTGSRPDQCTFWLMSAVQRGLPQEGACYPVGGPAAMGQALTTVIERNGGQVLIRAEVTDVVMTKGRVTGVKVKNAKEGGDEMIVNAREGVISAAGYPNTWGTIVKEDVCQKFGIPTANELASDKYNVPHGDGFFMANISINGSATERGIANANMWFYPVKEGSDYDIFAATDDFWADPINQPMPAMCTFPSIKDKNTRNDPNTTCQMLVPANWSHVKQFAHLGPKERKVDPEYQAFKKRIADKCLEKIYKHYPKVKPEHIHNVNLSTPLTIAKYIGSGGGSAIGLAPTPQRFEIAMQTQHFDTVTNIPGLYQTGQDILIMGVPLAQLAGAVTALRLTGFKNGAKYMLQQILGL
eukprot:TRINITY_DN11397_c0_g1_i1.p1 TRINITY_DN11397_c0_g1~~TRINITY_DN11397_c0_g1_i1.p1  ORF type:complete len:601 (-),score=148.88 TRINITY_DN11397_c0_g1_i1:101-1903(-)